MKTLHIYHNVYQNMMAPCGWSGGMEGELSVNFTSLISYWHQILCTSMLSPGPSRQLLEKPDLIPMAHGVVHELTNGRKSCTLWVLSGWAGVPVTSAMWTWCQSPAFLGETQMADKARDEMVMEMKALHCACRQGPRSKWGWATLRRVSIWSDEFMKHLLALKAQWPKLR